MGGQLAVKITYSWADEDVDAANVYFQFPFPDAGVSTDVGFIETPNQEGSVSLAFDDKDRLLDVEVLGASAMFPPALLERAGDEQVSDIPQPLIDAMDKESKTKFFEVFDSPPHRRASNSGGEVPLKTTYDPAANYLAVYLDYPLYEREIVTEVGPISTPEGKGPVTLGFGRDDRFLRIIVHGADTVLTQEMRDNAERLGDGRVQ
jgi:hypothetical protein